ncbi:MAG: hypothetical protein A3I88_00340 [Candidatus Portnoybacteria bacterium RIFCSPLOWO2_12_FULL_39_9]|uniref:Uncharacterized protein n=1 Tax=Candidatus Portnoybacteria bacterium RIFCSPHIGHO2_12_FULL_38_9 TaxID=1801997 RepID=A0A1G2FF60_9BACT|nr:MAG: hypothetical protein A3H00_02480 [Candidatus Portnoybacteria bacterium RBG_13_40_8]OGZ36248.1 MAG: hypothetical protein A3J64_00365 [Candidatus Portnoybacteria bacterium RIFCSPHIGHO2_12_FULL_38_9]OGZ36937.1 MAG: hypothetical protein A2646_03515 [Candidatus Portnoybacteria bacterium RIFCSPHIGHO2_02_FULL_39_12]OGZ37986.1 MAG: hypothetical protein A3F21_01460 [Candidatus Portnoybacteria bacterium RIFCSPLOWO2_01_FULL_38_39]OGZ40066.1 MAG: hypothetical protein A3I88_00340 [Candidatus Portnoy
MSIILYLLIIFSLIGLSVVIGRKIPRLARLSEEELAFLEKRKILTRKYREINNHHYRVNFMAGLEKFLRRAKILSLKTENLLGEWIKKLREESLKLRHKSRQLIEHKSIKNKIWIKTFKGKTFQPYLKEKKATALEREGLSAPDQSGQISIADLEKPIKEEQQWIDLIIQNPKNTIAYKALGMLYWKQHNYADAKASLEMTVKLGSKDKKVKEILDELKKIEIEDKPA